jgi:hypothetical protein
VGYLKCDKCGGSYELQEGESPEDFTNKCECGGTLRYIENSDSTQPEGSTMYCPNCGTENKKTDKFCSSCGKKLPSAAFKETGNSSKGTKGNLKDMSPKKKIGAGVCCVGVIIIIIIAGLFSSDSSAISSSQMHDATNVTAAQLYSGSGDLIGKPVTMTGEVLQVDSGCIRIADVNLDEYGYNQNISQDILVYGETSNLTLYENDIVVVYGIFKGQTSYTTVLGANRNVPEISNAVILPTGSKVKT